MPPLRDEVVSTVRRCIADSLAIEGDQITLQSRLVDDLGASSLDFIDIVFMLEKDLGIRVRETEFNFLTRLDFTSPEVMREGALTPEVIQRLLPWLPALQAVEDRSHVSPKQLFSFITVEAICIVVDNQLTVQAASPSS
jgi:acyl carrier protein